MKKLILIIALSALIFTGCNQTVTTKDVYLSEYNNLMKAVNDLSLCENIKEVQKEYSGLFSDAYYNTYYKNYDNIYYLTEISNKTPEISEEAIDNINSLVKKYFVRIIINHDEDVILFQTVSKLGYGEFLIYSKNKTPYSEKTIILSSWLDDNWYIATSN